MCVCVYVCVCACVDVCECVYIYLSLHMSFCLREHDNLVLCIQILDKMLVNSQHNFLTETS